ncbi:uncharacterized protein LOC127098353 isoform X2 [Lathyrus oleraceus]|uniref:uncharacterized protein LOC127098353 isoform X2 n=1 Tax=Pisum sativum TaxID=3888 RepID=UPI0021CE92E2|nr:uncharacterized protein LOC127098353 isoform X2 [Pisum sativum]
MNSLQFRYALSPHSTTPRFSRTFPPHFHFPRNSRFLSFTGLNGSRRISRRKQGFSICCSSKIDSQIGTIPIEKNDERPPFDINLAVILAGFAFEAYTTPPENLGRREVDAGGSKTIYLSEEFFRELYDGQLFIKLKKGSSFPAMDPWGTSDPYMVIQMDSQSAKSNIKWGTKEPTWNEEFTFNFKRSSNKALQVAAWDANLVTPHKRMGNAVVDLEWLCDGDTHEILVELEGMGGGGEVWLEVKYKTFEEIDDEKKWWKIPFVSDFLKKNGFDSALRKVTGSDTVQVSQFVEYAFGQIKSFNNEKGRMSDNDKYDIGSSEQSNESAIMLKTPSREAGSSEFSSEQRNMEEFLSRDSETGNEYALEPSPQASEEELSNQRFWMNFSNVINANIVQKLGLSVPEKLKWDGLEFLNKIGSQSQDIADDVYIQSGLAMPGGTEESDNKTSGQPAIAAIQSSLPEVKKVSEKLMKQTESILGGLMLLTATVSKMKDEGRSSEERKTKDDSSKGVGSDVQYSTSEKSPSPENRSLLNDKQTEEMRALFSTAESAMEAWTMLATSLGHPSFIKSEFEKICFLDNASTDTQVAVWRDSVRRRLVIAFRGTEQTAWKDLVTDLMLVPAGLNPERIGGDFKQEIQVHSGFLSAYDSVRTRIISLIRLAIGYVDDHSEFTHKWHIYITGHSLGGALATLLALELSSNQLKVKDSWRVVNHRDIIPTIPRLMGYCHVNQPLFLAAGVPTNSLENKDILGDGYEGDVLGESTPDVIVNEFIKGEMELIEKLLQTEINIFRSIRDGSAYMQHMEDFYYITLLENVRSNYQVASRSQDVNTSLS